MSTERTPQKIDSDFILYTTKNQFINDDLDEVSIQAPLYNTKTSTFYPTAHVTITFHKNRSENAINTIFFNLYREVWTSSNSQEWDSIKCWDRTIWLNKSSLDRAVSIAPRPFLPQSLNLSSSQFTDLESIQRFPTNVEEVTASLKNRGEIIVPFVLKIPHHSTIRYRQVSQEALYDPEFIDALFFNHSRLQTILLAFFSELDYSDTEEHLKKVDEHIDFLNEQYHALNTYAAASGFHTFFIPPLPNRSNSFTVLETSDQYLQQICQVYNQLPAQEEIPHISLFAQNQLKKTFGAIGASALHATEAINKEIDKLLGKIAGAYEEDGDDQNQSNLLPLQAQRNEMIERVDTLHKSLNKRANILRQQKEPYSLPVLGRAQYKDLIDHSLDLWEYIGSFYNRLLWEKEAESTTLIYNHKYDTTTLLKTALGSHYGFEIIDRFYRGNVRNYAMDVEYTLGTIFEAEDYAGRDIHDLRLTDEQREQIVNIGYLHLDTVLGLPFVNWDSTKCIQLIELFKPRLEIVEIGSKTINNDYGSQLESLNKSIERYKCLKALLSIYRQIPHVSISCPEACIAILDASRDHPLHITNLTIYDPAKRGICVDDDFFTNLRIHGLKTLTVSNSLITGSFLSSYQYRDIEHLTLSDNPFLCSEEELCKAFRDSLSSLTELKTLRLYLNRIAISLFTNQPTPQLQKAFISHTRASYVSILNYDYQLEILKKALTGIKENITNQTEIPSFLEQINDTLQHCHEALKNVITSINQINPADGKKDLLRLSDFVSDLAILAKNKESVERFKEELDKIDTTITTLNGMSIKDKFILTDRDTSASSPAHPLLIIEEGTDAQNLEETIYRWVEQFQSEKIKFEELQKSLPREEDNQ